MILGFTLDNHNIDVGRTRSAMRLRTYKIIDLIMISIIAFGLEILTTWLENSFLGRIRPYPVLGLLLTLVAITRWGWIGLIVAPINAVGNFIAGRFMLRTESLRDTYDFLMLVLTTVSNLSASVAFLWYKNGKEKVLSDLTAKVLMLLSICGTSLIANVVLTFCTRSIFGGGVSSLNYNSFLAVLYSQFMWNIIGYIVFMVGAIVLSTQGVLVDVKQKLVEKKQDRIAEAKYYNEQYDPLKEKK